jgi:hypothetical protein
MESYREESKVPKPHQGKKQKRFRLIRLEERIAPGGGHGNGSNRTECKSGCFNCYSGLCGTASIE